jgi:hypothetical protein
VKLVRPGFGPAAELPTVSPARRRHGGCRSPLGSSNVIGGNRRAAPASARGTGRTAYTKDVSPTNKMTRSRTLSMRLRVPARPREGSGASLRGAALPNVVEQFARPNVQSARDQENAPHACVACAEFDIRDVVSGHAHALGELLLRESAVEAELGNSLPEEL